MDYRGDKLSAGFVFSNPKARTIERHDGAPGGGLFDCHPRQPPLSAGEAELRDPLRNLLIERGDPVVIEARGRISSPRAATSEATRSETTPLRN